MDITGLYVGMIMTYCFLYHFHRFFGLQLIQAHLISPYFNLCVWQCSGIHPNFNMLISAAGTCGHGVPIAAVNMENSGERYGYADGLLRFQILPLLPTFIYNDVECKHCLFREKAQVRVRESQDPVVRGSRSFVMIEETLEAANGVIGLLPDLHGTLHNVACQVGLLSF